MNLALLLINMQSQCGCWRDVNSEGTWLDFDCRIRWKPVTMLSSQDRIRFPISACYFFQLNSAVKCPSFLWCAAQSSNSYLIRRISFNEVTSNKRHSILKIFHNRFPSRDQNTPIRQIMYVNSDVFISELNCYKTLTFASIRFLLFF